MTLKEEDPGGRKSKFMKAKDLDKKFDDGEDIGLKQRRVNVDFPEWMIESLDKEA